MCTIIVGRGHDAGMLASKCKMRRNLCCGDSFTRDGYERKIEREPERQRERGRYGEIGREGQIERVGV